MSIVLYQFPISHFCEKVRWALDYKGLDYRKKNLIPGAHLKTTMKLTGKSSVPLLEHNGKFIQGSAKIITYLDEQFPDKKLTPINAQEKQAALEWERYLDQEIGVHIRRYLYHTLLRHRGLTVSFLTAGNSVASKVVLWIFFPKLSSRMRKFMDVNDDTAAQSKQQLNKALQRINSTVADKKYLVGEQFSRADLSACALLGFLIMPDQYGLKWPQKMPEPLASDITAMKPQLQWVRKIYQQYR